MAQHDLAVRVDQEGFRGAVDAKVQTQLTIGIHNHMGKGVALFGQILASW